MQISATNYDSELHNLFLLSKNSLFYGLFEVLLFAYVPIYVPFFHSTFQNNFKIPIIRFISFVFHFLYKIYIFIQLLTPECLIITYTILSPVFNMPQIYYYKKP